MYAQALAHLKANVHCQNIELKVHEMDFNSIEEAFTFSAHLRQEDISWHAEETHRTTIGKTTTIYYCTKQLVRYDINAKRELCQNTLPVIQLEHERLLGTDTLKNKDISAIIYYLVHDGDNELKSLSDIEIAAVPTVPQVGQLHDTELEICEFYENPFKPVESKVYEHFVLTGKTVDLNGQCYTEIKKKQSNLGEMLNDQYLNPAIRLLIKLRLLQSIEELIDQNHTNLPSFIKSDPHAKQKLAELNQKTYQHLVNFLANGFSQRKAMQQAAPQEEKTSLSGYIFNLAQHIPPLRLAVGHASKDVHRSRQHHQYNKAFFTHKISSLLHWPLIGATIRYARKAFKNNYRAFRKYRQNKLSFNQFAIQSLSLLKPVFISLYLPATIILLTLSGLTSIPFYLMRKAFNIKFGGMIDEALTFFEAIKDLAVLYFALPLMVLAGNAISSALLGSTLLNVGNNIGFWLLSPLTGVISMYTHGQTYDYYDTRTGQYLYSQQEGDWSDKYWQHINNFFALPIVSSQFLLGGASVAGYMLAGLIAKAADYVLGKNNPLKFSPGSIGSNFQNQNHPQWMKNLLGKYVRQDDVSRHQEEEFNQLEKCVLQKSDIKQNLSDVIVQLLENDATENKNELRFAQINLSNPAYIPSRRVLERLQNEDALSNEAKQECKRLLEQHTSLEQRYSQPRPSTI